MSKTAKAEGTIRLFEGHDPRGSPAWGQDGPKTCPRCAKTSVRKLKMRKMSDKMTQDGAKRGPEAKSSIRSSKMRPLDFGARGKMTLIRYVFWPTKNTRTKNPGT